jgi:Icc-related predicted phosphoesterase
MKQEADRSNLLCAFVSDLHGHKSRYEKLYDLLMERPPGALFIGGDILQHGSSSIRSEGSIADLTEIELIADGFKKLRSKLGESYPRVFIILGNDDTKLPEKYVQQSERDGLWMYMHNRRTALNEFNVYGYAYVNPTPFLIKDWEKYDVSRFVDPGCVSPEEGYRTVMISSDEARYSTIAKDLDELAGDDNLEESVFLFHVPPYQTNLDRAALDGRNIDHVPLDVNVGSIAVRRFIESRQPLLSLHGHVHESARLTKSWRDRIGRTHLFSAAHDGPELATVWFNLSNLDDASRVLV